MHLSACLNWFEGKFKRPVSAVIRGARPALSGEKPALARPAKLTKSAGRSRAKLTADSIDTLFLTPTNHALKEQRVGKSFHFTLFSEIPFKSKRR